MDFSVQLNAQSELDIFPTPQDALEGELTSSVIVPLGLWWQSPAYGNALAARPRQKYTQGLPARLRQSLTDATAWLTRLGKAGRIDVEVTAAGAGRINYKIIAYKNSQSVILERFYDVSGSTI